MRAALTFLLGWMGIAAALQSFAAQVDPNSGCPPDDPAAHRQRPGEESPDRLQPEECDPTRLPTPTTSPLSGSIPVDRWRIIDALGHPANITDPYNTNNVLKGDRPIWGKDRFSVLTASTTPCSNRGAWPRSSFSTARPRVSMPFSMKGIPSSVPRTISCA